MHEIDFRKLDLNLLHVLHVLLEERSVSRAAERLHLSQSATSHALSRLRQYFDDPLLTRNRHGMQPTTRAETLAPGIANVLADVATLVGPEDFDPAVTTGLLRITAGPTATMGLVPNLFNQLQKHAPKISIDCCQWSSQTFEDIEGGKIDMAIGTEWHDQRPWVQSALLMEEPYICVVRKDHPLTKTKFTRKGYESWPHLIVETGSEQANTINYVLDRLGIHRSHIYSTHHGVTAHLLVENSDMVLTVTKTIAEYYLRAGKVTLLKPPLDIPPLSIQLFWHPRNATNRLHQWMRGLVSDTALALRNSV